MDKRWLSAGIAAVALLAAPVAAADVPATGKAEGAAAVEGALRDLTAEDFGLREQAARRLQALLAEQLKQRAAVEEVVGQLQAELLRQERALGMMRDDEARQRTAGLLAMEQALAAWTQDAMTAPNQRRQQLLEWGLSAKVAPLLARTYSKHRREQIAAIIELGKLDGPGADWTLARLLNERESWVRAAAVAALWNRPLTPEIAAALWYRAVEGPEREQEAQRIAEDTDTAASPLEINIPDHDPVEVPPDEDDFSDRDLLVDLLVHLQSPLVAEKVEALVDRRTKKEAPLGEGWEHRLVEAYKIKTAVPLLARVATGEIEQNSGRSEGGQVMTGTNRTSAAGALATIVGIDPAEWNLRHV
jgi:hypothetical protein